MLVRKIAYATPLHLGNTEHNAPNSCDLPFPIIKIPKPGNMAHTHVFQKDPPDSKDSMPSKNPLPLSATQEAQVRDVYYARVRGLCAEEIKGLPCEDSPHVFTYIAFSLIWAVG